MGKVNKFRGIELKGSNKGKWVYGGVTEPDQHGNIYIIPAFGSFVAVYPETVGQYIGNADGREVYEGDLFRDYSAHAKASPYEIKWSSETCRYGAKYKDSHVISYWDISDAMRDRYVGTIHDDKLI